LARTVYSEISDDAIFIDELLSLGGRPGFHFDRSLQQNVF
jgi:hypothetical protein